MTTTERLMQAVLASEQAPYLSVLQRRVGLSDEDMRLAVRHLTDAGQARIYSAPLGELLYPTLLAAA